MRSVPDLPAHGRRLRIALTVRRLRRATSDRPRMIFAERFGENILAPYAAFPLALVDRTAFASWLGRMLSTPRMWGPNGIGESFRARSSKIAPKLTWDGKMLPMMAWMGGISDDLRTYLRRDGLYQGFLGRVEHDFSAFAGKPIEGRELRIPPPPGTRKGGLSALAASL